MKIAVNAIEQRPREVAIELGLPWSAEAARLALGGEVRALAGIAVLEATGTRVQARVQVSALALHACDRCGEAVEVSVQEEAELLFLPRSLDVDEGVEVELDEADLDVGWYDGGEINLATVVSETLALALPSRFTCDDKTGCEARTEALLGAQDGVGAASPFAALKDLLA